MPLTITPFFAGIDRLADLVPPAFAAWPPPRPAASAGGKVPSPAAGAAPSPTFRQRIEGMVVERQLRNLLKVAPSLSDDAALDRVKSRYRDVLEGVRRDYGLG